MNLEQPLRSLALPGFKRQRYDSNTPNDGTRGSFNWIPAGPRQHILAMIGEFVGTFMFLFFAFAGTQVANTTASSGPTPSSLNAAPNTANLLYIALAFGFSLVVNAWVFFRITGGLFNPAVTFGLCLIGGVPWFRGLLIGIAQVLGGIAAAGIVSALFPGTMGVQTTLGGGTSVVRGLFIEMFLTAELIFTIFMLAAEKHKATFIAPIGIGLALFIAHLAGIYFTGTSVNPARSFGPAVIARDFPHYHWIYWLGPFLGALVAVGFYKFVKALEYESVNPGQDFNAKEAEKFANDEEVPGAPSPEASAQKTFDGTTNGRSPRRSSDPRRTSGTYQEYPPQSSQPGYPPTSYQPTGPGYGQPSQAHMQPQQYQTSAPYPPAPTYRQDYRQDYRPNNQPDNRQDYREDYRRDIRPQQTYQNRRGVPGGEF